MLQRDPTGRSRIGTMTRLFSEWRRAAPGTEGVLMRECAAPAPGRAKPPELARREARPACEGAREMGRIGIPEVERDLDDLAGWLLEHPLRNLEAGPRDDARVGHALVGQPTLERPGTEPHHLGDGTDVRVAAREQSGDELLHDAAEPGCFARSPRPR